VAVFASTGWTVLVGTTWSAPATAPGLGAGVTIAGTISASVDLSSFVADVMADFSADELDWTNFASGGFRQKLSGLQAGTLQLVFNDDLAASASYSYLRPGGTVGYAAGQVTPYYMDIKASSAARSATNPSLVVAWLNNSFSFGGSVGDLARRSPQFPTTGGWAMLTA
jgi:hypothetical protein